MKVLWLINTMMPSIALYRNSDDFCISWIVTLSELLSDKVELTILYPDNIELDFQLEKYYCYSYVDTYNIKNTSAISKRYTDVINNVKPDVIHIWGTEFIHSYIMTEVAKSLGIRQKTVISIQGLVSVIAKHYMAALPEKMQRKYTFRDFIKRDRLIDQKRKFEERGVYEIKALLNVDHVIGRTDWDNICTKLINPELYYHFNNEILRKTFYENTWNIDYCQRHRIFISQGYYPIKGFHFMIEAIAILKRKYPDVEVYVAGFDSPLSYNIKTKQYQKYNYSLSKKLHVFDSIIYTGQLDEQEILSQYLNAHVFVSASAIENSPNSLGEAMMLGMPIVSSYVGGVANMLLHGEEGYLYQYDAPYMLAGYIDRIFSDDTNAVNMGKAAKLHAEKTHNISANESDLMEIYKSITAVVSNDSII